MTLVTIDLGDVAGGHHPDDHVIIRAENFRESQGGGITSTAEVKIPLVSGVGQAEVEPGPVVVAFRCQAVADTREKRGVVPESGPVGVEDVIAGAFEYTPPVVNHGLDLIEGARDEALGQVEGSVDTAINGRLVPVEDSLGELTSIVSPTASEGFRVRDTIGEIALAVTPDGDTMIGGHLMKSSSSVAFRIRDRDGLVALEVANDGTITGIPDPIPSEPDPQGTAEVTAVRVIIAAGQSNMAGVAQPVSTRLDPRDGRIWQYGVQSKELTTQVVPLDGVQKTYGLSPSVVFAREYAQRIPPTERIVIIPAAVNSTGFSDTGNYNWNVGSTGELALFSRMITHTQEAIQKAQAKWGVTPTVEVMLWIQGEDDVNMPDKNAYQIALDTVFTQARVRLGVSTLPIIVGQMSPNHISEFSTYRAIDAIHQATPSRILNSAFAPGEPSSGRTRDLIHYAREGIERLGGEMFRQLNPARQNNMGEKDPQPPQGVVAVKAGGVVTVTWDQPYCRISSYLVEWADATGTWTAMPAQDVPGKRSALLPPTATQVRISTDTPDGLSSPTHPIPVIGA